MERRDSRAGARHRGTQRHVVATGGVSRARAFGYGLCECVCVVSNKVLQNSTHAHTTTHITQTAQNASARSRVQPLSPRRSPLSLLFLNSCPPSPQGPYPFSSAHSPSIPHSCPFTPAPTAATPLCVFFCPVPQATFSLAHKLQCCMHCALLLPLFSVLYRRHPLKERKRRRHHPLVR